MIGALEQAHKIWSRQGIERFKVRGLKEDPVFRAVEKWRTFYEEAEATELEADGDTLRVVLKGASVGEFPREETLWFPARLMLMGSE